MERQTVKSSNIASVGYNEENKELEIEFRRTGGVYLYSGVSKRAYNNLMNAESKGHHFAKYIKNSYVFKKV